MRLANTLAAALAVGLAAAALPGCVVVPRWIGAPGAPDLAGRAAPDGAPGTPQPGRHFEFGEEDWRYGEMEPPGVDPYPMTQKLDQEPQLNNSPASNPTLPQTAPPWPRLGLWGSSEEEDGGGNAAGAIIVPF
jgi:hypothetical protein